MKKIPAPIIFLIAYAILATVAIGMVLKLIPSTLPIFTTICVAKVICFVIAAHLVFKRCQ